MECRTVAAHRSQLHTVAVTRTIHTRESISVSVYGGLSAEDRDAQRGVLVGDELDIAAVAAVGGDAGDDDEVAGGQVESAECIDGGEVHDVAAGGRGAGGLGVQVAFEFPGVAGLAKCMMRRVMAAVSPPDQPLQRTLPVMAKAAAREAMKVIAAMWSPTPPPRSDCPGLL